MGAKHILLAILLFTSVGLSAKCRHYCYVKYEEEYGWSKYYHVQVTFETGMELNQATGTFNYNGLSNYAVIFWGEGQASVIKISSFLACGYEVDCDCIENLYSNLKGTDQRGLQWTICTGEYCF